jgi:autotransporter-associated beta strand protein
VAAGRPRIQWYGSGGFAAYGGDRTITIDTATTVFFDLSSAAVGSFPNQERNGELLLSAPDSDGKITVAMAAGDSIWLTRGSAAPYIGTIRVYNGSAPVDAEISAPITVGTSASGGFQKMGAGVLELSGSNSYNGPTIVAEGGLVVTGSTADSMLTDIRAGAWLGGNGTTGAIEIHPGGKLAPGTSIGTLKTSSAGNGYFLWNGETDGTAQMQFELSTTDNTSDMLDLGSDAFLKGTGTTFTFDFLGGGMAGETYTLVTFGSTTFTDASDFSYTGLGGGYAGDFVLNSGSLQFTVSAVPEPASIGVLGLGAALLVRRRRRL